MLVKRPTLVDPPFCDRPPNPRDVSDCIAGLWGDFFIGQKQTATGNGGEKLNSNFQSNGLFFPWIPEFFLSEMREPSLFWKCFEVALGNWINFRKEKSSFEGFFHHFSPRKILLLTCPSLFNNWDKPTKDFFDRGEVSLGHLCYHLFLKMQFHFRQNMGPSRIKVYSERLLSANCEEFQKWMNNQEVTKNRKQRAKRALNFWAFSKINIKACIINQGLCYFLLGPTSCRGPFGRCLIALRASPAMKVRHSTMTSFGITLLLMKVDK